MSGRSSSSLHQIPVGSAAKASAKEIAEEGFRVFFVLRVTVGSRNDGIGVAS